MALHHLRVSPTHSTAAHRSYFTPSAARGQHSTANRQVRRKVYFCHCGDLGVTAMPSISSVSRVHFRRTSCNNCSCNRNSYFHSVRACGRVAARLLVACTGDWTRRVDRRLTYRSAPCGQHRAVHRQRKSIIAPSAIDKHSCSDGGYGLRRLAPNKVCSS
jgi:hypothetical protein